MSLLLAAPIAFLEVAHVAHRLGFSQDYVRRLIRDKELRAIRFGKRWRIDPTDLQAFIDRHRVTTDDRRQPSTASFPQAVNR